MSVAPPKVPTAPPETIPANSPKSWRRRCLPVNCPLWLPWRPIIWSVPTCNTTASRLVGGDNVPISLYFLFHHNIPICNPFIHYDPHITVKANIPSHSFFYYSTTHAVSLTFSLSFDTAEAAPTAMEVQASMLRKNASTPNLTIEALLSTPTRKASIPADH